MNNSDNLADTRNLKNAYFINRQGAFVQDL
jgi:hypothetical protein